MLFEIYTVYQRADVLTKALGGPVHSVNMSAIRVEPPKKKNIGSVYVTLDDDEIIDYDYSEFEDLGDLSGGTENEVVPEREVVSEGEVWVEGTSEKPTEGTTEGKVLVSQNVKFSGVPKNKPPVEPRIVREMKEKEQKRREGRLHGEMREKTKYSPSQHHDPSFRRPRRPLPPLPKPPSRESCRIRRMRPPVHHERPPPRETERRPRWPATSEDKRLSLERIREISLDNDRINKQRTFSLRFPPETNQEKPTTRHNDDSYKNKRFPTSGETVISRQPGPRRKFIDSRDPTSKPEVLRSRQDKGKFRESEMRDRSGERRKMDIPIIGDKSDEVKGKIEKSQSLVANRARTAEPPLELPLPSNISPFNLSSELYSIVSGFMRRRLQEFRGSYVTCNLGTDYHYLTGVAQSANTLHTGCHLSVRVQARGFGEGVIKAP
ncbi:hypothetical protein TREMEDRAFT_58182 [Tremella mesenterica DSM 1558]|uniref:uncharacterized protein n=1 Tax=Tremella mesenterica (strain ATCC 24925 / CBS 8224 / DSM 1558 / NBRC 9311 / NRRL Y-6157 / RJB 2259-6 / UBC 559-6) TaxID=578456 RepID=UPI0003F49A1C|nr:uncharacterized protein TREMEDRAFT_58182 [Tremella mesenterica DSM 1558]EIW72033.1 hypothetical protein TREMEDRAFT_58182 [Tremella mesenterica DSM 1558]